MVLRDVASPNPMQQFRREIDRVVSGFFPATGPRGRRLADRGQPGVNVWAEDDVIHVEMELPGVQADQIDLSVAGNELTLKVHRPEMDEKGVTYHRRERPVGSFTRVLRLRDEVDADKVEAELTRGVLLVRLPTAESARPRKIEVR